MSLRTEIEALLVEFDHFASIGAPPHFTLIEG